MRKCPFCAEEIQDAAIKCRHCESMLPQPVANLREDPTKASQLKAIFELVGLAIVITCLWLFRGCFFGVYRPALIPSPFVAATSNNEEAAAVAYLEKLKNRCLVEAATLFDSRAGDMAHALDIDGLKSYERLQPAGEESLVSKQTGQRINMRTYSTNAVVRMGDQFMAMRLTIYVATDTTRVFIVVPSV